MTSLPKIAELGNPILRLTAKPVTNIKDPKVQRLIDKMLKLVMDVDGVGVSAPQVFQSLQIFIMASHPNSRYPYAPEMSPTAVINPKIIEHSREIKKDWEGCLSIPGIRAMVPRCKKIKVSYFSRNGKKILTKHEDFLARIFQHEFDHLNGKVFLDRVKTTKDIYTEKEFQKIIAKRSKKV